jgi:hypothetical protein
MIVGWLRTKKVLVMTGAPSGRSSRVVKFNLPCLTCTLSCPCLELQLAWVLVDCAGNPWCSGLCCRKGSIYFQSTAGTDVAAAEVDCFSEPVLESSWVLVAVGVA